MFGRIAFCNTVSDLYAMGITDIKEVLMILGVSTQMQQIQKDICTTLMIQGFTQAAVEANTQVGGGQTVYNEWPIMGGCAISVVLPDQFVMPNQAQPNDVIILTKPLGTRLAINAMQWLKTNPQKRQTILKYSSQSNIIQAYYRAQEQMATLSIASAHLIQKYSAHATTDVTGFGILGHANYLAQAQLQSVDFIIQKLPIYKNLIQFEKTVQDFKFKEGYAAETSGGLLICIGKKESELFRKELQQIGIESWEIGYVREGTRKALLAQNVEIEEV